MTTISFGYLLELTAFCGSCLPLPETCPPLLETCPPLPEMIAFDLPAVPGDGRQVLACELCALRGDGRRVGS